jgi:hypothetical protein
MATQQVWELTTNEKDGYAKWYVRGITSMKQAKAIALKGFGKKFMSKSLYTHYSDYPSEYGTDWLKRSDTIAQFIKKAQKIYGKM